MTELQESEGWKLLIINAEVYATAVEKRLLQVECEQNETNFLRGVMSVLRTLMDEPIRIIEEANQFMEENEKLLKGQRSPLRRNIPRGL